MQTQSDPRSKSFPRCSALSIRTLAPFVMILRWLPPLGLVPLGILLGILVGTPPVAGQVATAVPSENDAAEVTQEISPADAKKHVGKKCVVEFMVASSTFLKDKRICFLNSEANHRDEQNFSVVIIGEESLQRFADKEMSDPAESLRGKTIRVEGVISLHRGSPQIKVESPDEIQLVEDASN
jgi:DNA/RNA endonuclease YhcR with UshA esterase domain